VNIVNTICNVHKKYIHEVYKKHSKDFPKGQSYYLYFLHAYVLLTVYLLITQNLENLRKKILKCVK